MATALVAVGSCGEAPPKEPADLLNGHRYVVPATRGGLQLPDDCDIDASFIPIATCASAPERDNLRALRKQLLTLRGNVQADDRLYDWVSAELASGAADNETARQAVAIIQRGLTLGDDGEGATGSMRAQLLTDLSAAYLLVAEETQSAVEVLAALEASLEALELEELPEAKFNRDLALVLLGVLGPGDVEGEPELFGLASNLLAQAAAQVAASPQPGCPSQREMGLVLDTWLNESVTPSAEMIEELMRCAAGEDQFFAEILGEMTTRPESVLRSWSSYRAGHKALRSSNPAQAMAVVAELGEDGTPKPLKVAAGFFEGIVQYLDGRPKVAESHLFRLVEEAEEHRYFGLAATTMRMLAVIADYGGDYDAAIRRTRKALRWAELSGAPEVESVVKSFLVDLLETAGREDQAWNLISQTLRQLDPKSEPAMRTVVLEAGSRLASERAYARAALLLQSSALRTVNSMEKPLLTVGSLLARAELAHRIGDPDTAQADLNRVYTILGDRSADEQLGNEIQRADADLVAGLIDEDPVTRVPRLQRALQEYERLEKSKRILDLRPALAGAEIEGGDPDSGKATLLRAIDDFRLQVEHSDGWPTRMALVAKARPIIEDLLELLLNRSETSEVIELIKTFASIRVGSIEDPSDLAESDTTRWTTFSLETELLHIVEANGTTQLTRTTASRATLSKLRNLLLTQLESAVSEHQLEDVINVLSETLVSPVAESFRGSELVVVPDDALVGIPFSALRLPNATSSGQRPTTLLLDVFAISYAADHRRYSAPPPPDRILAIGSASERPRLPRLSEAAGETRGIARQYPSSALLVEGQATPEALLEVLAQHHNEASRTPSAVHLAAHFLVNYRNPLDSVFVLSPGPDGVDELPLGKLLEATPGLHLLYLSACETGISLPPSPHGLRSLSHAFSASGIREAVLTHWRIDDENAALLALEFHRRAAAGISSARALRLAQLALKDEGRPTSDWASVALYR